MSLHWLTNEYDPTREDAENYLPIMRGQDRGQAWRHHQEWLQDKIIALPRATSEYSVEDMEAAHIVGIYSRMEESIPCGMPFETPFREYDPEPSTDSSCDLEIECDALRDKEARILSRAIGGNIESRELAEGTYEHAVKETPMQWTTEYPTQPGFYWVKNMIHRSKRVDAEPHIVGVIPEYPPELGPSDMEFYFPGNEARGDRDDVSAEWYGPIEPPE